MNSTENITFGFYNSVDGDRKYNAEDFGMLFDGIITDGVFSTIGDGFVVKAVSDTDVKVGTGKAWFNRTWTWLHEPMTVECTEADTLQGRYDMIAITIDSNTRTNSIEYVEGTAADIPQRPTPIRETTKNQYPLCYIYRPAGSEKTIESKNVVNAIGTNETPIVAASIPTIKVEDFVTQWNATFEEFISANEKSFDESITKKEAAADTSIAAKETAADTSIATKEDEFDEAKNAKIQEFDTWYNDTKTAMSDLYGEGYQWYQGITDTVEEYLSNINDQLSEVAEVNLQVQITRHEIISILMNGFPNGIKVISEDGSVITTTDSIGRTLTKTFTNEFATSSTVLKDGNGTELGSIVKTISSDGLTIGSEITINPFF